ncbi:hypothetical protein SSPO_029600 [Streptomyces antimycoticus]|uniref:Thiamine pyrophosphate enzyme TPP-binding domain-containing protein n=1 Tax=Streptomyces antimycoticus TaxID=68175 RepID=A0A499UHV4_9ACTN|nr:hypothetical protein SSPO_029600 [Streptomyces antimycoticus]
MQWNGRRLVGQPTPVNGPVRALPPWRRAGLPRGIEIRTSDFPYGAFLSSDVRTVQVDVRAEHLGRRSKLDLAVWGDVRETLSCLTPKVRPKTDRCFLDRMLKKHADALEGVVKAYTRGVDKHIPIHPEFVASVLDEEAADDAIFTVDTGMCNVWAARYLSPNGRRRMIGSFTHDSMADALPQAIGAQ